MIFHSHGNTTPFLQERLPISLNFEKMAFCNSKKPNPNRQLKCINICKLIKNVVFRYKKTTEQKSATYIPTLPQNKLKRNVHSSTTKKSTLLHFLGYQIGPFIACTCVLYMLSNMAIFPHVLVISFYQKPTLWINCNLFLSCLLSVVLPF